MRALAKRRFPIILIILFALVGVALSVAIGRVIASRASKTVASGIIEADSATLA
jgi:hypothetical protein